MFFSRFSGGEKYRGQDSVSVQGAIRFKPRNFGDRIVPLYTDANICKWSNLHFI